MTINYFLFLLYRNFKPSRKTAKGKKRSKKNALQPVMRDVDDPAVTNINCYMTQMMAASLGLKLFDTTRRILMYTKKSDDYKEFYAICRGFFPIHELVCCSMLLRWRIYCLSACHHDFVVLMVLVSKMTFSHSIFC